MQVAFLWDQSFQGAAAGTSLWDVLIDPWCLDMSPYPVQGPVTLRHQPGVHGQRRGH
jgi:hypothetical protein